MSVSAARPLPSNQPASDELETGLAAKTYERPTAAAPHAASLGTQGVQRYELTPPQRLAAIVLIAALSALVLLLLLIGTQALTQAFEGLTPAS